MIWAMPAHSVASKLPAASPRDRVKPQRYAPHANDQAATRPHRQDGAKSWKTADWRRSSGAIKAASVISTSSRPNAKQAWVQSSRAAQPPFS
jgi:hypothetical protein